MCHFLSTVSLYGSAPVASYFLKLCICLRQQFVMQTGYKYMHRKDCNAFTTELKQDFKFRQDIPHTKSLQNIPRVPIEGKIWAIEYNITIFILIKAYLYLERAPQGFRKYFQASKNLHQLICQEKSTSSFFHQKSHLFSFRITHIQLDVKYNHISLIPLHYKGK